MAFEPKTGWLREEEDTDYLHNESAQFSAKPKTFAVPVEFVPDSVIVVENQGNMSSCTGHGESSGGEACDNIARGGNPNDKPRQFAPMFSYLMGQKRCNMLGRDNGATIAAVVEGGKQDGHALKETFPYPGRYTTHVPPEAIVSGQKNRIKNHVKIRGYEDGMAFMQGGHGPLVIGITWTSRLANSSGVIRLQDCKGNGGGHCVLIWGWDKDGRWRLHNSHGTQWANGGRAWVEKDAAQFLIDDGEFIGISDLDNVDIQRPMLDVTRFV